MGTESTQLPSLDVEVETEESPRRPEMPAFERKKLHMTAIRSISAALGAPTIVGGTNAIGVAAFNRSRRV